jgi:hypothetical protein
MIIPLTDARSLHYGRDDNTFALVFLSVLRALVVKKRGAKRQNVSVLLRVLCAGVYPERSRRVVKFISAREAYIFFLCFAPADIPSMVRNNPA